MQRFNDIANERYNFKNINDNDAFKSYPLRPETRDDGENEALADDLMEKLGSSNRLPLLAVGYSEIPRSTIDRHLTTALEKGRIPVKLFMHLIKKEPLWRKYQQKKSERERNDEA
jgi:hypothetical protein